ncbi:2-keto-4-pentenoate hydratase [Paraburkholderia sp. RL17-347-BIC-D]|uniref:2-keto-4-pentenoate hydratase n=1 Tax=Paraburkholderia sp. RL17-347-BIC-D TaxID=3031632 RepID=UPI0038B93D14
MNRERLRTAAQIRKNGNDSRKTIRELLSDVRPLNKAAADDIQREYGQISNLTIAGWKIAATSLAGQKHIGVVRPIAGLVFEDQILAQGSTVSLSGSVMKIAEAEFAFRMRRSLVRRNDPYESAEVLDAIGDLLLAFEIPNSRYEEFSSAGELQLIADRACAAWLVLKKSDDPNSRDYDFARHAVRTFPNGQLVGKGSGADVLGSPLWAMTWLANELRELGIGLEAEQIVTTVACAPPVAVEAKGSATADFGSLGTVSVSFV